MARFVEDFHTIYAKMGLGNATRLIMLPRICSRLGFKRYSFEYEVNSLITKNFEYIVEKYSDILLSDISTEIPNIIWFFWWQGEDGMPPVIKECYKSLRRNSNGKEVRLLSQSNYLEYVKLPDVVERKFRDKKISFPHFSDILRLQLLIRYGGLWIDAAVFTTKAIEMPKCMFYSPKVSEIPTDTPHMSQWVIGVMGAPPKMPLCLYAYDMLTAYWQKYNGEFHYLMFDYFIRYGYEHLPWVKTIIDERPILSPDFFSTRYTFNQEVNYDYLRSLLSRNTFLSLTYRMPYAMYTADGKETYYAALLNMYHKDV